MSEPLGAGDGNAQIIREMIEELHAGASPDDVKERFKEVLKGISPIEIAQAEEQLVNEGLPREEIQRLCEVHLAVFKETLEKQEIDVPPGHPIHILLSEHRFVKETVAELSDLLPRIQEAAGLDEAGSALSRTGELLAHLREYDKHKVREENCLFPYLEKHGVTEPPAIMWSEHDDQRDRIKQATRTLEERGALAFEAFRTDLLSHLTHVTVIIPDHFFKEENILFPAALSAIGEAEFGDIKASMDDLGYCYFTPKEAIGEEEVVTGPAREQEGRIPLETGSLSREELEAMLNTLPVDVTFVDSSDTVRYFSLSKDRIFPRTKAIIGRNVQQCHPQKSIHVVEQIVDDLKSGRRDVAEFWIRVQGRLVHIRYIALRGRDGEYLGCMEVSQDITDLKQIEGEKRLL